VFLYCFAVRSWKVNRMKARYAPHLPDVLSSTVREKYFILVILSVLEKLEVDFASNSI